MGVVNIGGSVERCKERFFGLILAGALHYGLTLFTLLRPPPVLPTHPDWRFSTRPHHLSPSISLSIVPWARGNALGNGAFVESFSLPPHLHRRVDEEAPGNSIDPEPKSRFRMAYDPFP